MTEGSKTLTTALLLREAGVACIPVKHAPDKKPLIDWKKYINELPTEEEARKWFSRSSGIAIVGGKVQCLDFDEKYSAGILNRFATRSTEVGLDYLIGELIRQRTPTGGFHLVWRCEGEPIRNIKLANKATHESLIETRGDGGYFLISPSDGYTLESGDWSSIPTISEDDRDALLSLARTFDEKPPTEQSDDPDQPSSEPNPFPSAEATPGDDYDQRADIPALLRSHGWKSGKSGKYWTRPGKNNGVSATWDIVPGRFFVFTSSTAFTQQHVYRPWHVYAILECGGDFRRAAAELRRQGFGAPLPKKKRVTSQWDGQGEPPAIEPMPEGVDPKGEAPTIETEEDKLRRMLRAREFDANKTPPPLRPIYSLGGVVISTPGNLTAITAQAKVGKSALTSALTASTMADPEVETDLLTAQSSNPDSRALVYYDTEQAPDDFWYSVKRAQRRAKREILPEWIKAYSVADFPTATARKALAISIADAAEQFGGIHSIIIDGVADLVLDVNDAAECNAIVAELHGLAIRYECAILCVIHKNPGSEKVRGHLGSQIERKAETNLSLDKEDAVTVVWSNKQRRAPIDKKTGPRFQWDDELKMHVTVQNDQPKATQKVQDLIDLAESVLKPGQRLTWKELVLALQNYKDTGTRRPVESTVDRWINAMKKAEILVIEFGSYALNPKFTLNTQ